MYKEQFLKIVTIIIAVISLGLSRNDPKAVKFPPCINMSGFALTLEERTLWQKENKQTGKSPSLKRDDEQGTILVDDSTEKFKDVAFIPVIYCYSVN